MAWLRITCGVKVKSGRSGEHPGPAPVWFSATTKAPGKRFFLQHLFVPASVILKRELLWIPFFRLGAITLCAPSRSSAPSPQGRFVRF